MATRSLHFLNYISNAAATLGWLVSRPASYSEMRLAVQHRQPRAPDRVLCVWGPALCIDYRIIPIRYSRCIHREGSAFIIHRYRRYSATIYVRTPRPSREREAQAASPTCMYPRENNHPTKRSRRPRLHARGGRARRHLAPRAAGSARAPKGRGGGRGTNAGTSSHRSSGGDARTRTRRRRRAARLTLRHGATTREPQPAVSAARVDRRHEGARNAGTRGRAARRARTSERLYAHAMRLAQCTSLSRSPSLSLIGVRRSSLERVAPRATAGDRPAEQERTKRRQPCIIQGIKPRPEIIRLVKSETLYPARESKR